MAGPLLQRHPDTLPSSPGGIQAGQQPLRQLLPGGRQPANVVEDRLELGHRQGAEKARITAIVVAGWLAEANLGQDFRYLKSENALARRADVAGQVEIDTNRHP